MWGTVTRGMKRSSLTGTFECSLDNRFRLAIPAKHRPEFAHGVTVARWLDGCLAVVPSDHWPAMIQEHFGDLNIRNDRERWLRRYLMAGAYEQDGLDKQGRFVIPPELRDRLQLGTKVKLVGGGEYFELWNPALIDSAIDEMDREGVLSYGNDRVGDG